ncbi:SusC/RagA family TonB-linked outer membrane protein [Mucilaginibacter terrae]|uniref:SusC/RagA family TonB-linked outer membrane protein n=1 Tax=Mucilaginibacter terrae TaxID=1955052 RepID=UPI003625BC8D
MNQINKLMIKNLRTSLIYSSIRQFIFLKRVIKTGRVLSLSVGLLLIALSSVAQSQTKVSGIVTDNVGQVLPGVTVKIKNANGGTITDAKGAYTLVMPAGKNTLIFSFTGFDTREVLVSGNRVDVKLQDAINSLNDVVVIGYATQKRGDLTGSIASVTEGSIKNFAVTNVSQLLQGQAAGVYVASNSGQPGDPASVRIRGFNSTNNNNPLYVVDGQFLDDINNVNPNDIASMDILKDASATAIYGSRGSNGVIVITTKQAKKGDNIVSFDSYAGLKSNYAYPRPLNADEYYEQQTTAVRNQQPGQPVADTRLTQQYLKGYNTNWYDALNQTPVFQTYNLNVRNGTEKARTALSLNYQNEQGSIITTRFQKAIARYVADYDLSKRIKLGINISQIYYKQNYLGGLPGFAYIFMTDPLTPVINPNIDPSSDNYEFNKYAPAESSFQTNSVGLIKRRDVYVDNYNTQGNINARINIFKGLSFYTQSDLDLRLFRYNTFTPYFVETTDVYNTARADTRSNLVSNLEAQRNQTLNYTLRQQLEYNNKFGKHAVTALLGTTYEKQTGNTLSARRNGTPSNDEEFRVIDAGTTGIANGGGRSSIAILSYLSRVGYNYDNRYLLNVNFRADGSSRFREGQQWGYFPSFGLRWQTSNEAFFKKLNINKYVSSLSLRGGYGLTGNQQINSNNAAFSFIGTSTANVYNFGTGLVNGYVPTSFGNENLKWEVKKETNIGIDAAFFKSKLNLTADVFSKKTEGILLQIPLPASAGYNVSGNSLPFSNAGNMTNRGLEITLNYRDNIGKYASYRIGGNASFYENKVTSLGNGNLPLFGTVLLNNLAVNKTEVGGPISRFYAYKRLGIFQNKDEITNYVSSTGKILQPLALPGEFKFQDTDGNGVINDDDRVYVGNPHPDMIFGFNLGFTYKDFDITALFQGTLGNDLFNSLKSFGQPKNSNGLAIALTNAWKKEGDDDDWPIIMNGNPGTNANYRNSSWYVEDGSYLRCQNVQIGYSIPSSLLAKAHLIRSCRFFVSGQNLFTLTKYTGLDPEIGSSNVLNLGYDPVRYPTARTITAGLNIQF